MAQWLRTLVLAEDPGSIPSTHIIFNSRRSNTFVLQGHQAQTWYTDTLADKTLISKNNENTSGMQDEGSAGEGAGPGKPDDLSSITWTMPR